MAVHHHSQQILSSTLYDVNNVTKLTKIRKYYTSDNVKHSFLVVSTVHQKISQNWRNTSQNMTLTLCYVLNIIPNCNTTQQVQKTDAKTKQNVLGKKNATKR